MVWCMLKEITVQSKRYEDYDNSLGAAAREYAEDHDLEMWQVEARWADDERDEIVLTVPA